MEMGCFTLSSWFSPLKTSLVCVCVCLCVSVCVFLSVCVCVCVCVCVIFGKNRTKQNQELCYELSKDDRKKTVLLVCLNPSVLTHLEAEAERFG